MVVLVYRQFLRVIMRNSANEKSDVRYGCGIWKAYLCLRIMGDSFTVCHACSLGA
jgi:hypothetical protein